MNFGFVFPGGEALAAAGCAQAAEAAGWTDLRLGAGVGRGRLGEPHRRRLAHPARHLGTMLTPLSRMRPWKLAGETATLDRLSNGRVILAVGLGAPETGFANFGEVTDRKTRAKLLDEGLEIISGLWRGQPFSFSGKHYHITPVEFNPPPPPIQTPIPIWVVGLWPNSHPWPAPSATRVCCPVSKIPMVRMPRLRPTTFAK